MKNFMNKYHHQIDQISVGLFLYSLFVFIFAKAIGFIGNDYVCISIVLLVPFLIVNKKNVNTFNAVLHRIFRFKR